MNESSKLVIKSLDLAHKLGLQENVSGIINCPINKLLLKKRNVGVTEYLASKCKINDGSEVMLIRNKKLSVSPITTHIDIKNIAKKINSKIILRKILEIERWFKKNLKRKTKIAVLGLNPHNAELRKDSEENRILIPAISKLKKLKVNVSGPFVTDTIFISEYKKYDVIVGMYHDQVLAPFKTLFKFDAINITLGLSYLRVSPDHGVALDLIGKNKANSTSLVNCIKFINQI
jgi:4-hydroxythreonine-4-phosphate dehydrogenase